MLFLISAAGGALKRNQKMDCRSNQLLRMLNLMMCFWAASVFMICSPSVAAQQQQTVDSDPGIYKLGVGDVLDIVVHGEPEISRNVTIRSDGRISLPLTGDLVAEGFTPPALAEKISAKLTKFIEVADVTVILSASREKVYYVLGQVGQPGEFIITQPITVLQAIARAGGFLEWAKKSRIMIVNGPGTSEKILYFDYDDFLGGDSLGQVVLIRPGDTIVVP